MRTTKKISKSELSMTVIMVIGILVVVNFFSYHIFYRWDLTQDKIYSISPATKRLVGNLDDIVTIKAYFSKSLPSQFLSLRQEVADILNEYENYSHGKIKVKFIDPGDDEETKRELYMIGIPELTFQVYEKDKMQMVNGYMGIAVSFAGKTEVIPAVKRDTSDLEYQLTTAIKKVVSDEIATVGFVISNGTADLNNEISQAYKALQELYTVRRVDLSNENDIPDSIKTLIIVGPKEKFSESELKKINAFVMHGGSLLVLLDGVKVERGLSATKNEIGLEELLKKYGITVNYDLVADRRNGMASFTQGFITFTTNYPLWPKITHDGFNQENGAVANLENVVLPWASSVEVDKDKLGEGAQVDYLAFTTNQAWREKDSFNIAPQRLPAPTDNRKQYNLAVAVNGNIKNAYPDEVGVPANADVRIIVVGDSDFIRDSFLGNTPDNLNFFQNLVDSLSFDTDLISIRSKGVTSRPIKELSDNAKAIIRYLNVFSLTVVVILIGLLRYFLRRRRNAFVDGL
jgi:gliding-associated putative ABC transporter substrate-binding component GldG